VAAELAMRSSAERLDARATASMMANSPRGPVPVAIMAADARQPISQYQEFGILGQLTPGQHHQAVEQAAR
jgi:hypothetical protein